ncbi:MucR family transcriptional regulator [Henriciella mobilis]|uniref:MucR family transcriptional regulator n=1 Tax=Henriciella mobilis TaxID=2305467 RepID=A0A399RDP1_9PROT|nr:MucR family transcriptional regulator [Henriciella mobilis]RIJ28157.1 MucR family transcriptional regulator [Henriciella mobilis]
MPGGDQDLLLELTTDVIAAFVSKNPIQQNQLPALIQEVHSTLNSLAEGRPRRATKAAPAISPAKSITPDFLICLEDGRKLKMLKRYLRNRYGLTPEEYREKWSLPEDYPMVAPNYAAERSKFAKQIGLGRKQKPAI